MVREAIVAGQSSHSVGINSDPNKASPDSNHNISSSGLLEDGSGSPACQLSLQGHHNRGCNTRRTVGRGQPTASVGLASWPAIVGFAVTTGGGV